MSTRACIYEVEGNEPPEDRWEFDLHEDMYDRDKGLDVHAYDPRWEQRVEFTLSVEDVKRLRDSLSDYLDRSQQ